MTPREVGTVGFRALCLVIPLPPGFVRQSQCPIIKSTDNAARRRLLTPKCGDSLERHGGPRFWPKQPEPNRLMLLVCSHMPLTLQR
jgi:hypothetical protein